MASRQLKQIVALAMIGEGVMGLLYPRRQLLLWQVGPKAYREAVQEMVDRPALMRLIFAAEAGLGVWWAARQIEEGAD